MRIDFDNSQAFGTVENLLFRDVFIFNWLFLRDDLFVGLVLFYRFDLYILIIILFACVFF